MSSLVYRCRHCPHEIACGIEVDDVTLATIAFHPLMLTCSACGAVSAFRVDEGVRGEEGSRIQMAKERLLAATDRECSLPYFEERATAVKERRIAF